MVVDTYLLIGFGVFVVGVGLWMAWLIDNKDRCFGPPNLRPLPKERPKGRAEIISQAEHQKLRADNDRLEVELGAMEIQLLDLRGHMAGEVCMLCNNIERALCFEQKEKIRADNDRLTKVLTDLCFLKTTKDKLGKTPEYLRLKPRAWEAAFEVLQLKESDDESE